MRACTPRKLFHARCNLAQHTNRTGVVILCLLAYPDNYTGVTNKLKKEEKTYLILTTRCAAVDAAGLAAPIVCSPGYDDDCLPPTT